MTESSVERLSARRVDLNLPRCSWSDAIPRIVRLFEGDPAVVDLPKFRAEVIARERIAPTTLGYGVAFPHARTEHVGKIVLAAGRCREGIEFGGAAGTVHLVFVIGVPNDRVAEYLGLIGNLTRRLKDAGVREALMAAESPEAFAEALR